MRRWILIVSGLLLLLLLLFGLSRAKRWWEVDKCWDAGGRWDYAAAACDFGAQGRPRPRN